MLNSPLGPGFFIFFQKKSPEEDIQRGSYVQQVQTKTDRIKEDDEEILLFLQMVVTRKLL